MHEWIAVYRIDSEPFFTVDTNIYHLDTTILSVAAVTIEQDLGPNVTLISLERII